MPNVLVVDDDPASRFLLRVCLEADGYAVREAGDGAEALAQLQRAAEPLIVLLDYRMPVMDGWDVLRCAAAQPELLDQHAFVLTTADADALPDPFTHLLHELGVGVLPKPLDLRRLCSCVRLAASSHGARLTGDRPTPAPAPARHGVTVTSAATTATLKATA